MWFGPRVVSPKPSLGEEGENIRDAASQKPRKEKGMGNSISCWRERSQKKSEACGRVRNEGAMINPGKSRWGEWQTVGVDVRGLRDQRNSRRASAGSSDPNSNIT